jgi:hypothetical protein
LLLWLAIFYGSTEIKLFMKELIQRAYSFNAISVSKHINKISLEYFQAWHSSSTNLKETWLPPPIN